jgi:hypothetical protein
MDEDISNVKSVMALEFANTGNTDTSASRVEDQAFANTGDNDTDANRVEGQASANTGDAEACASHAEDQESVNTGDTEECVSNVRYSAVTTVTQLTPKETFLIITRQTNTRNHT